MRVDLHLNKHVDVIVDHHLNRKVLTIVPDGSCEDDITMFLGDNVTFNVKEREPVGQMKFSELGEIFE